ELCIPVTTNLEEVGELVLNYLDQTAAIHES
ncbi:sporulation control protein Spo0M, partial [Vibrio sp. 1863]|nr:sporulation control protein Spo0M [Vibrio sp. 1863]